MSSIFAPKIHAKGLINYLIALLRGRNIRRKDCVDLPNNMINLKIATDVSNIGVRCALHRKSGFSISIE